MKCVIVAGARPNFMKIAPLCHEFDKHDDMDYVIVHTGQHYDENMSKVFFDELQIPRPDINLNVGSQSHAVQTAQIMIGFEKVILDENPDCVIVVGDVNSTIACALVAAKLHIPVAHVEAGLRSFNMNMPEEINRVLTDHISSFLFTSCLDANENLINEGISKDKIFFVGNVMIDTLLNSRKLSEKSSILTDMNLQFKEYGVLTMHRPSNVDSKENISILISALEEVQKKIKIIYPVHPRTRNRIEKFGFEQRLQNMENLMMIDPIGYLDFLHLMANSRFVITDSGGIQEETTILGIPCFTIREETERPVTLESGTNEIIGLNGNRLISHISDLLNNNYINKLIPEKWDGKASNRIVDILIKERKNEKN